MKRVSIILAAALAALLLFAACGQTEPETPVTETVSEEPAVDTPTAGSYAVTSADGTKKISAMTLMADGSGTLTESGTESGFLWRCEAGELTLMLVDGRVLTGEVTGADTLSLLADGVSYTFTRGAEASGEVDADIVTPNVSKNTTDAPADADPDDENNIYGADMPEEYEDDTPTDEYITLGAYGAVGITDAAGKDVKVDGDIVYLTSAETDPSENILVTGKGTFIQPDSYILFRYKLTADGMFRAYWCDSGPDEYTGDFMQEILSGAYIDDTLVLTDAEGNQYRFELDAEPEQTHDYEYTADNNYGGNLPCAWE